jgi:dynein heavy chain
MRVRRFSLFAAGANETGAQETATSDAVGADAAQDGEEDGVNGGSGEGDEEEAQPPVRQPKYVRRIVSVPKRVNKLSTALGSLPEALAVCPAFYFIAARPGRIAVEDLDSALEFGLLSEGPSLRVLEQMLSSVFVPILLQISGADTAGAGNGLLMQSMTNSSHRELLANMQKFHSQVAQALQQLTGDVTLLVSIIVLVASTVPCVGSARPRWAPAHPLTLLPFPCTPVTGRGA